MDLKHKKFKISIRISIITVFVILLGFIGGLIITINHFTLNKILLRTSQNLILETSSLIKQRLQLYLLPLNHDIVEAGNLITKGVINPNDRTAFDTYLFEMINHNPYIYGAYWGTTTGDFYGIDRELESKLTLQHTLRSTPSVVNTRYELDEQGQVIKTTPLADDNYDPRQRPWYQAAERDKRLIWTSVYPFHMSAKQPTIPGITAAIPIYNKQQQLLGVLGIDLTISQLKKFVNSLQVSKNTIIYITDQNDYLVALRTAKDHHNFVGKKLTPALIHELQIPLPVSGLSVQKSAIISYYVEDKEYFATYQSLIHNTGNTWHVTIIVPADDIVAPLKRASLRALLLAIISLLGGILMVRYISQRISQPIIQLADEAKTITNLELSQPTVITTIIKEISYMSDAFEAMRNSLRSFQRYVPNSLVKNLISSGKIAEIGGENRELSILFADINGFTSLAEHTEPQQLMHFLSDYFETMSQAVIESNGTLDKYIGDAIMAFWNAPLTEPQHAYYACQTAVTMLKRLADINQYWTTQGIPKLDIRIGINTGSAIVGNVGSHERLNYTAIGDNVNLASRLETLNKIYDTPILVSQTTYEQVKNQFNFRFIDHVAVRGKEQGVAIYELITDVLANELNGYEQQFLPAFTLYQQGEWQQSLALFTTLAANYPNDKISAVFIKRCRLLIESPPAHWDGIWRME